MDLLLIVLALYLIQEGEAQRARPDVPFFVHFPITFLPLAYAALILLVTNLALVFFVVLRGLRRRRWPWVTTLLAIVCLGIIVAQIGFGGVYTIIHPTR